MCDNELNNIRTVESGKPNYSNFSWRHILRRIPKQTAWLDNMTGRPPVWSGESGNVFLEIREIAIHKARV